MFYRLVKNNADIWANIVVHNVVGVPYILPQKILETLGASLLYLHCKIRLAFFTWPSFTKCDHLGALFVLQGKCARDNRQLASPGGHYRQVFSFFTVRFIYSCSSII
jgi:hypothetical protein